MFSTFLNSFLRSKHFQAMANSLAIIPGLILKTDRDDYFIKKTFNESVIRSILEKQKMPTAKDIVTNAIQGDSVVIFSKKSCPFCKMAKGVFDKLNKNYTAIELDGIQECDEIQDILEEMTGARTVPRVFVKGQFIGGGTDVKRLYDSGELQKKLEV